MNTTALRTRSLRHSGEGEVRIVRNEFLSLIVQDAAWTQTVDSDFVLGQMNSHVACELNDATLDVA